ncbi:MAG: filamentous hemagglutinin N-terminal domain-containing protein, partial [Alphaproteobacteria bacterium]|nr:filamentous hemagglutinin N-terminal domain-containing protein [Alphaproteobacteria bacterium]
MYAVNGQVETHRKVFRWRFRTKGKEILNLCACFTCCLSLCGLLAAPALANPSGGTVTAGSATISSSGDTLSINQSSSRAVIEWSGFDISAGETTQFIQPSSSAVTLNRVVNATQASVINGNLLANGKVLVINPNGVLIGPKGNVDVAGFIASSADIGDGDFMNATGAMHFDRAGRADAVVENRGRITIRDEGLGLLVAPEVRNSGVIEGNLSRIQLAAGDVFGVDLYGDGLLSLAVKDDGKARSLKAENAGTITANAGKVLLTAAAANNVVNSVINTSGVIEAQGLVAKGGEVILTGADAHVGVSGRISVNGKTGGGTVKIGTETATQAKAATVDIAPDAVISADALENGNGGAIAIWSDESTGAHGSFTARGGAAGGDGGFIETSATDVLDFSGARVDTSAPQGAFGTWLLDPTSTDITDATAINGAASDVSLGGTDRVTISTDINMTTAGVSLSLTAGGSGISMSNHYIRTNGGDVTWSTSGVAKVDYGAIYTRGGAVSITGDTLTLNNSGIGTGGGAVALTATANPTGGGTKTLSLNSTNIDATGGAASGGISFYDGNPRALFTGADAQAADRLGNGNTFESSVDGGAVTLSGKNVSGNGNCLSAGGTSCGVSDPWHGTVALAITADDQTKIYGYGDPTLGYTVTSGALESGDSFTGALARTAGENVGYYDITQGTLDVSSASGYVYVISFTNGKLYITPAQLTITARDQGKTYGADYDLGSTSFDVTGLKYSDDVTGVTLTSAGADKAAIVGDYAITPSSAIGTGLSNYNIAFHDGNLTVNRAKLTVTADSLYKSYGSAFSFAGDEYALSGTLYNGDALTGVSLGSAGADKTAIVGGYTITASGATGTGLSNYHIDYVSGIFTVNPAKLTLMARDQSKTYGSTFTFNGDEYTLSGTLYNGDAVTGASLSSFGAPGTAQKGGYDIDISGASGSGLSNYDISYTKGSFTVDPAKLTLTAKNQSKTYGSVFTFAGDEYTLSGTLYNGDVVTGASLSSLGAPGAANKGGYDIGISGARGTGLSNYYIDYAKGTLTVDPAKLTLTAKNQSKTYGSVFTFAGNEYTLSGTLYNG